VHRSKVYAITTYTKEAYICGTRVSEVKQRERERERNRREGKREKKKKHESESTERRERMPRNETDEQRRKQLS